jgi:hypothetical protein
MLSGLTVKSAEIHQKKKVIEPELMSAREEAQQNLRCETM